MPIASQSPLRLAQLFIHLLNQIIIRECNARQLPGSAMSAASLS